MINGMEYAFEDVEVVINGLPLDGFTNVQYGTKKDHKNVHARGNKPVAMARGKKDSEPGILTILQSQFEAFQAKAPKGSDPCDWAPFPMVVAYAPTGGVIIRDVVPHCRVNSFKKGMSTEDGHMTIDLNLTTGLPKYNV